MADDEVVAVTLLERQAVRHVMERVRLILDCLHDIGRAGRKVDEFRVRIPDRIDARIAVERNQAVHRVAVGGKRDFQHGLLRA